MKFCVGMMMQNEAPWIQLHLPVILASGVVDGVFVIEGSADEMITEADFQAVQDVCETFEAALFWHRRPFDWKFDVQFNTLIDAAEEEGFHGMLRLDPDEVMWPEHVAHVRRLLERYAVLKFPRYNFTKDRVSYCPQFYPDHQGRAFQLHKGLRYFGTHGVHETLWSTAAVLGLIEGNPETADILSAEHINIYHYAGVNRLEDRAYRNYAYSEIMNGKTPGPKLPDGWDVGGYPFHITFTGPQPIDPEKCGLRAPVGG